MSLQFNCPYCQLLMSTEAGAGGQIQCPSCRQVFMLGPAAPVVPVVQPRAVAPVQPSGPPQPQRPASPPVARPGQPRPPGTRAKAEKESSGSGMVIAAVAGLLLLGGGVIYGGLRLMSSLQEKAEKDQFALSPETQALEKARKAERKKEDEKVAAMIQEKDAKFQAYLRDNLCNGDDKVAAELKREILAIDDELTAVLTDADPNNDPKDKRAFWDERLNAHCDANNILHHWLGGRPGASIAVALWGDPAEKQRDHGKVADFLVQGHYLGTGTGFFISQDGWMLTNEHVVKNSKEVDIRGEDGVIRKASVVKTDVKADVALLKAEKGASAWLPLGKDEAQMGANVFTIGFPNTDLQGVEAKFTDGRVSSLTGFRDATDTYQITVPVQPGNSGGPLVDMKTGSVTGIVSSILSREMGADNVSYAIKGSVATRLLESVPEAKASANQASPPAVASEDAMIARVKSSTALIMVK